MNVSDCVFVSNFFGCRNKCKTLHGTVYGDNVMRKSTTKSTIQFDPLLLKFSMDDINSLAITLMLMLAVSDRTSGDVRKPAVVC